MDLNQLANLGEFIGGLAVLVTLVYLAVQVRQNTRTVRAQSQLDSARQWSEQVRAGALDPEILRILEDGFHEPSALDEREQRQFAWWMAQHLYMAEGFFHSREAGLLSEESWVAHERVVMAFLAHEAGRRLWEGRMASLSDSFVAHFDVLLQRSPDLPWDYPRIREFYAQSGAPSTAG